MFSSMTRIVRVGLGAWLLLLGTAAARADVRAPEGPAPLPPLPACEAVPGNRVEPVFGVMPFVERLTADIAAAQKSVLVDFYVLGGENGMKVARALEGRHRAGIEVKVILDEHRGVLPKLRSETRQVIAHLHASGVPVRWAVSRPAGMVLHRWTEDHNKLVIIDGQLAYCGGCNIGDSFARFNDLMMRVDGPAASRLESVFRFDWEVAGRVERPEVPDQTYPGQGLLEHHGDAGTSTVRLVGTGIGRLTFEAALVNAIRSARSQIQVQQHQFGYDLAIDELIAAHQRGVEVRVLVDPCNIDNFVPVFHHGPRALFNAHAVLRLQRAGVPVRAVKLEETFEAYHMKLGTFDRRMLLVGSGNWERIGCRTSTESVLEIAGGPATGQVVAWHDRIWTERSEPPRAGYFADVLQHLMSLYF